MEVLLHWIGGAGLILSIGNLHIGVDPVLCPKGTVQDYFWFKSKRIEAPVYQPEDFDKIDLWLITHNHEDHLDAYGLKVIKNSLPIISNPNASKLLLNDGKTNVHVLQWQQHQVFYIKNYIIDITAIPAIHGINPLSALFAGKGNGYYISVSNGQKTVNIYLTGDTVYKNKIVKSLRHQPIDLMIPNMGAAKQGSWIMTLTLNAKMLQKLQKQLQPKIIIPVHFGTFEHYKEPVSALKKLPIKHLKILKPGDRFLMKF